MQIACKTFHMHACMYYMISVKMQWHEEESARSINEASHRASPVQGQYIGRIPN